MIDVDYNDIDYGESKDVLLIVTRIERFDLHLGLDFPRVMTGDHDGNTCQGDIVGIHPDVGLITIRLDMSTWTDGCDSS